MVLALRRKVSIKVRQPLSKIVIPVLSDKVRGQLEAVKQLILNEVNVKDAEFIADATGLITMKIKPNFKTLGKVYGKQMKEIAAAFGCMDQKTIGEIQADEAAGLEYKLALEGGEVVLRPGDYEISSEDMPGWLVATEGRMTIALDVEISDELRREGVARELINRIQNLRKDSGFEVTDRVSVEIFATGKDYEEISSALVAFRDYIMAQTLTTSLVEHDAPAPEGAASVEWNDKPINIVISKTY